MKAEADREEDYVSKEFNRTDVKETVIEANPATRDFYTTYDPFTVTPEDEESYTKFMASLSPKEKELMESDLNFYEITFKNVGGLVMPIILEFQYADGTSEIDRIPVEIWRKNETEVTKVFVKEKEVTQIILDPKRETADIDESSNYWPPQYQPSRFELFKGSGAARGTSTGSNPMKEAQNNK